MNRKSWIAERAEYFMGAMLGSGERWSMEEPRALAERALALAIALYDLLKEEELL